MPTIQEAVNQIKTDLEAKIRAKGKKGKTSFITSKKLINVIHEAIKSEILRNNIPNIQVKPEIGISKGEIKIYGSLKQKSQDIVIFPNNLIRQAEEINTGYHLGENDPLGVLATEQTLSINVRSQLSSLDKNFDTLYERTIAEALNLHLRCPRMVLGEVYMIPVYEYNSAQMDNVDVNQRIAFSDRIGKLEKYLRAFNQISDRETIEGELYKYERVCLLIVDFNNPTPIIYSTDQQLKQAHLIPNDSTASIENLTFGSFIEDLLNIYENRFGHRL